MRRLLIVTALLALAPSLLLGARPAAAAAAGAGPSALVETAPITRGSLARTVTAYGTAAPTADARRLVMAPLAARVDALFVHHGEEVAPGASLVRLVPSPESRAAYARARSARRVARQLLARTRTLVRQHLATAQQLASARQALADAEATLSALEAEGAAGPRVLRAPFRAIVTAIGASPGALVTQGTQLVELARVGGLVVRVGLVPAEAAAVHPGDRVRLEALGADASLSSTVRRRGTLVESSDGLVPVEIGLPAGQAMPGETFRADIAVGRARGYLVPHAAILVDAHGKTYVMQAVGGKAHQVPVRILASEGDRDAVEGALDPHAPVVVSGNHQLTDGMRLRTAKPSGAGESGL